MRTYTPRTDRCPVPERVAALDAVTFNRRCGGNLRIGFRPGPKDRPGTVTVLGIDVNDKRNDDHTYHVQNGVFDLEVLLQRLADALCKPITVG